MLLSTQSIFLIDKEVCDPDLSIENQRAKKITAQAQKLLTEVVEDQVFFDWPVKICECWISSLFGPRKSGHHNGLDLAAPEGTPIYAPADGVIEVAQLSDDKQGYGNMILMSHKKLDFYDEYGHLKYYKTRYGHLQKILVKHGQAVKRGHKIGLVGRSGHVIAKNSKSDPSHLHFEIYRGDTRINPIICLFASDDAWIAKNLPGYSL